MAGRKPLHKFNTLSIGEQVELKGKTKEYVHQYVYQFNNSDARDHDGKRIEHFKEKSKRFIKRVA